RLTARRGSARCRADPPAGRPPRPLVSPGRAPWRSPGRRLERPRGRLGVAGAGGERGKVADEWAALEALQLGLQLGDAPLVLLAFLAMRAAAPRPAHHGR